MIRRFVRIFIGCLGLIFVSSILYVTWQNQQTLIIVDTFNSSTEYQGHVDQDTHATEATSVTISQIYGDERIVGIDVIEHKSTNTSIILNDKNQNHQHAAQVQDQVSRGAALENQNDSVLSEYDTGHMNSLDLSEELEIKPRGANVSADEPSVQQIGPATPAFIEFGSTDKPLYMSFNPKRPHWSSFQPLRQMAPVTNVTCDVTKNSYTYSAKDSDDWQFVEHDVTFVYSSYLDPRDGVHGVIRVFGLMRYNSYDKRSYYCLIRYEGRNQVFSMEARVFRVGTRQGRFIAVQFQCRTTGPPWDIPRSVVSITTQPCATPSNVMRLHQQVPGPVRSNFSVCLQGALKMNFSNSDQLVEWMELNHLMGAQHVHMYNYSSGPALLPYLDYYRRARTLSIHHWSLPINLSKFETDKSSFHIVWNLGQEVLVQDCLYRNMWLSNYVAFLDLDEFIVPRGRNVSTWSGMLREMSSICSADKSVYLALNDFFPTPKTELEEKTIVVRDGHGPYLRTMVTTRRSSNVEPAKKRSKYIVAPAGVYLLTVHHLIAAWSGSNSTTCVIPPTVGLMHHYRCLRPPQLADKNFINDTVILKYRGRLVQRVLAVQNTVQTGGGMQRGSPS